MSKELRNKLYDQEVPPPPSAWDKIASALDDSHLSDQFPTKLYDLEATPPAGAWNKVKAALGEDRDARPLRRINPVWRYAAAAAVIGAVAFGGITLLNNNSKRDPIASKNITTPVTNGSVENSPPSDTPSIATIDPIQELRDEAALEESKHLYASLDASDRQRIRRVSEEHFLSSADPITSADDINPVSTYRDPTCTFINSPSFAFNDDNSPIDMANRYYMMMTPEGQIIRISKKLGPMVCCVSGEEADEDCNNQLKKWREKLASPQVGATSGNFLELLNVIHNFRENNP